MIFKLNKKEMGLIIWLVKPVSTLLATSTSSNNIGSCNPFYLTLTLIFSFNL